MSSTPSVFLNIASLGINQRQFHPNLQTDHIIESVVQCLLLFTPVMLAFYIGDVLMFLAGTALTWSSPEIPKLTNIHTTPFDRTITDEESTWISSLVTLGAALGPYLFCRLADKMGRKYTLLAAGVPFLVCYLIQAFGKTVELFYVTRLIMGLTVGGVFTLIPIYAGEIGHKNNRGFLGALISCGVCSGLLFSYSLGPFVSVMTFNLVLAVLSAVFLVLFAILGEEVPHYYISINEDDLAKEALQKLRGDYTNIDEELSEIQNKFKAEEKGTFFDMFASKGLKKAFITSCGLLVFQQLSGINVVLFYSQKIFKDSDSGLAPEICTIIIGGVQFLSSFVAPMTGEKFGRRTLLAFSGLGMALSEASLAAFSYLKTQNYDIPRWMASFPVVCLVFFIITYNSGYGPLPWVMLGELFPSKVKSLATSCACFINWILAFFITKYFMSMLSIFGLFGYFSICAGCCVMAALFGRFYVIETRGKSLEAIQDELDT